MIAPFGPAFAPEAKTLTGLKVAEVLGQDERDLLEDATRLLVSHAIPVIEVGPTDNPAVLLRKISRSRGAILVRPAA